MSSEASDDWLDSSDENSAYNEPFQNTVENRPRESLMIGDLSIYDICPDYSPDKLLPFAKIFANSSSRKNSNIKVDKCTDATYTQSFIEFVGGEEEIKKREELNKISNVNISGRIPSRDYIAKAVDPKFLERKKPGQEEITEYKFDRVNVPWIRPGFKKLKQQMDDIRIEQRRQAKKEAFDLCSFVEKPIKPERKIFVSHDDIKCKPVDERDNSIEKRELDVNNIKKNLMLHYSTINFSKIFQKKRNLDIKVPNKKMSPFTGLRNFSNDDYYMPDATTCVRTRSIKPVNENISLMIRNRLRHNTDATRLNSRMFPTNLTPDLLRSFYKPQMSVVSFTSHETRKSEDTVVLFEYMERYPSILNQPGMGACICNYAFDEDEITDETNNFGFLFTNVTKPPIIGDFPPFPIIKTLECNLFKAHLAEHKVRYLVLVTMYKQFKIIHKVEAAFLVGQLFPQVEIPFPTSKRVSALKRELLQVHIFRQFAKSKYKSDDNRPKIHDIKRNFSTLPEASIRKKLKQIAEFNRNTHHSGDSQFQQGAWYLKNDIKLPTEEELRKLVTPEQCCAWYSMATANQRMIDNGIIDKSSQLSTDESEKTNSLIANEILHSPWNTSKAYIDSIKSRSTLKIDGQCNPFVSGLGFSFESLAEKEDSLTDLNRSNESIKKADDNSDKRRLQMKTGKQTLLKAGFVEETIQALTRWETIHLVQMITDKDGKFDRKSVNKAMKYINSSEKPPETALRNYIAIVKKRTIESQQKENEVNKNKQLCMDILKRQLQFINEGKLPDCLNADRDAKRKRLIITRTFVDKSTGKQRTETEVLTNQLIINEYVSIRTAKNDEEIKKIRDDYYNKQKKITKTASSISVSPSTHVDTRKKKKTETESVSEDNQLKFRCGACGEVGHMRTNRDCPAYVPKEASIVQPITEDEYSARKVGTKVVISRQHSKTLSSAPVSPVAPVTPPIVNVIVDISKKKSSEDSEKLIKSSHRRRVDPLVSMSVILEGIVNKIREMPEARMFLLPVSAKEVPDYHSIITNPIDLKTIRQRVINKYYRSREMFLMDLKLLVDNSITYNGIDSSITTDAQFVFSRCISFVDQNKDALINIEKQINPLLDEDESVVLRHVLENLISEHILVQREAWDLMKPVSKIKYPDYYNTIENPIDISTIKTRIAIRHYKTKEDFMSDIQLMYNNCLKYFGSESHYAKIAKSVLNICEQHLKMEVKEIEDLFGEISSEEG